LHLKLTFLLIPLEGVDDWASQRHASSELSSLVTHGLQRIVINDKTLARISKLLATDYNEGSEVVEMIYYGHKDTGSIRRSH
jgi:hypothetical protein